MGRGLLFYSLPVMELEFNKIGSTGREIGEVFKSGRHNQRDTALGPCGGAVVRCWSNSNCDDPQAHCAAQGGALGMLVDSDCNVSWATSQHESAAIPRLELSIGLHASA